MDVVLYMRYSSDRQTEQSIEGQDRVCMEFCRREGYNVVAKYIDRATSAYKDTAKRTEFNRMIRDADKQLFKAVIVYKLDRFARNRYDAATYKAKLKKNGIKLISATEGISDSPEGIILEAVLEGMAEYYSQELSQKITRGMMESAYKQNSTGAPPLGFKIEGKKYVIDEPAAQIVREAFERYAAGETVAEISDSFNAKGYRTARKGLFNKNSFHVMFKNERYIGVYKYKDVRIEDGMPQIIDKELFETVRAKMQKNRAAPARVKAKTEYLLSQKLFCGHCGSMMLGESGHSANGNVYNYYSCGKRKKHNSCDKKPLKKEWIERVVVEQALALITPQRIEELADMAIKQNREDINNDKIIPALQDEIKDIERRVNNLFKLVEQGSDSPALAARLKELEDQRRAAEKQIQERMKQFIVLEREHVIWWLSKFTLQGDCSDPKFQKHIIDLLINSVTVWDEPDGWYKITTAYNLTDNNKSRTVKLNCSDSQTNCPPLKYNPNIVLFFDSYMVYTARSYVS